MGSWIVCVLCAIVVLKPQEFVPALAGLPILHVTFGLGVVLVGADVVWRRVTPALSPPIPFALAFVVWALLTTAVKAGDQLGKQAEPLLVVLVLYGLAAVGVAAPAALRAFAATFVGCALAVSLVAIAQARGPLTCMLAAPDDWEGKGELEPDGRPCAITIDCYAEPAVPDGNYRCERLGPWGTSSVGGRVRYRGSLADPNELSLMVGMAIPYAVALTERRRERRAASRRAAHARAATKAKRTLLPPLLTDGLLARTWVVVRSVPVLSFVAIVAAVVVFSKSRSGLLVFLLVTGIVLLRRAGAWAIVAGSLVAPPMLLLGGRSGAEAEGSADERLELLSEALQMIRSTRGLGIGVGQFAGESSLGLTAHNAYLLAAVETGLVGMCLFGAFLYLSGKVPLAILFGPYRVDGSIRRMAAATATSLAGALVGIVFLSWSYKDVLYMQLAISAALYGAARAQDPTLCVRLTAREAVLVCGGSAGLIAFFYATARLSH